MSALPIFCANCQFYCEMEEECRRHAPRPRFEVALSRDSKYQIAEKGDDDTYNNACWPYVRRRGWCGEFSESGALETIEGMNDMKKPLKTETEAPPGEDQAHDHHEAAVGGVVNGPVDKPPAEEDDKRTGAVDPENSG